MSLEHEQVFSEKQVAQVLRRAAELQDQESGPDASLRGATAKDIQRIGEEVGLDPRLVAAALAEMAQIGVEEDHRGQSRWLGAPPEYTVERTLSGQLSQEGWETLVGLLNERFRQSEPGLVSGSLRSWRWEHELGWVYFSAVQMEHGVRLRLHLQIDEGLVAGLVPTVIAWFAATSLLFSVDNLRPWFSMLLSAVLLVGLAVGFRSSAAAWWRKDQRKMARLMDELAQAVRIT